MIRILLWDGIDIKPTAEAMAMPEFEAIKDKYRQYGKKFRWQKVLAYVYLMHCPCQENGYYVYDESTRRKKLKEDLFGQQSKFDPDDPIVKQAEAKFIEILENVPMIRMLRAIRKSLDELEQFIKTVDISERDKNGKPIYKPQELVKTANEIVALFDKLKKIEKDVYSEYNKIGRIRGGSMKGYYED